MISNLISRYISKFSYTTFNGVLFIFYCFIGQKVVYALVNADEEFQAGIVHGSESIVLDVKNNHQQSILEREIVINQFGF